MQHLEVSYAVRRIYKSLGFEGLMRAQYGNIFVYRRK